ncbi:hypothetical protein Tco_1006520 [Tanacetum coccineum]|uniref:Uncharacterized protein n=1 Tax=Tanacetum coccineum TaxID=301880 RepID=A0ABQ5FI45_9ASTR
MQCGKKRFDGLGILDLDEDLPRLLRCRDMFMVEMSLSSFITIAKGGSSLIFTLFSLPAGAELTFEAEELLLPLTGAENGSFIMTPFKVSSLNVDFDLKIYLIVFGPDIGSAPSNFFSRGRVVLQTEDSSAES